MGTCFFYMNVRPTISTTPDTTLPHTTLVRSPPRSSRAAAIVSSVSRYRGMAVLASRFLGHGWERDQGYGTPEQCAGIARLGVTALHRRSFRPVREALA